MNDQPIGDRWDIVRRPNLDLVRLNRQLGVRTRYRRYPADHPSCSVRLGDAVGSWTTYSAQRFITAVGVRWLAGMTGSQIWMATWGGVLCFEPESNLCTRYTSQHGLPGGAITALVVDNNGWVWAAGKNGGLVSLDPNDEEPWHPQAGLENWHVVRLTASDGGGVWAVLRNVEGHTILVNIPQPGAELRQVYSGGLSLRDVQALVTGPDKSVWTGNTWGLHCWREDLGMVTFDAPNNEPVRALAVMDNGCLWVATPRGFYSALSGPTPDFVREKAVPQNKITALALDGSRVWVAAAGQVGYIESGQWSAVPQPPEVPVTCLASAPGTTRFRAWAGSGEGLYGVTLVDSQSVLSPGEEELVGGVVHSLLANEQGVMIGGVRRAGFWDGQSWKVPHSKNPAERLEEACMRDVRSLTAGEGDRIYLGSWYGGPSVYEKGSFYPSCDLLGPVVSLTSGPEGSLWAAYPDALFYRPPDQNSWQTVRKPGKVALRTGLVQVICWQPSNPPARPQASLWVGTSQGLLCYRPEVDLWERAQEGGWAPENIVAELEKLSIQSLLVDPHGRLWVGTQDGLFAADPWEHRAGGDVCALAPLLPFPGIGPIDPPVWIGTSSGLVIGDQCFSAENSGLPASQITALTTRSTINGVEVWAGTPSGPACLRFA